MYYYWSGNKELNTVQDSELKYALRIQIEGPVLSWTVYAMWRCFYLATTIPREVTAFHWCCWYVICKMILDERH